MKMVFWRRLVKDGFFSSLTHHPDIGKIHFKHFDQGIAYLVFVIDDNRAKHAVSLNFLKNTCLHGRVQA
jgi:hypothetical protein